MTGSELGRGAPFVVEGYTIGERIGVGGFGEVYRARQHVIDRDVAIKILHARYSADPAAVARFVAEARAANRISHSGIVQISGFGKLPDGRHYFVMELLRGRTLRALLDERGRIELTEALPILRAIAEIVDAAHAAGIAHRDLKPDNVFMLDDGRFKLIDFGLAKLVRSSNAPVTETASVFGTPLYMSPEQCRGKASDVRTDAYSFGVMVYQMLVGEPPFSGEAIELALHHLNDPAPSASHACKLLPSHVDPVISALLAKDPAVRPLPLVAAVDALAGGSFSAPRSGRRGRIVLAAAGVVAATLTWQAWPSSSLTTSELTCAKATSRLAGIWDEQRKAMLTAKYAGFRRPDITTTLEFLLERELGPYARYWGEQWDSACHAADRTTDPLLYAQRINCLERTLVDLQGATRSVLDTDPRTFSAGWNGTLFIWGTPLEDCANVAALRAMPPAQRPEHNSDVARLMMELHTARAEYRAADNAGLPQDLEKALQHVNDVAHGLDALEAPAAAEAAMIYAYYKFQAVVEDPRAKRDVLAAVEQAITIARRRRDDRMLSLDYALQAETEIFANGSVSAITTAVDRANEADARMAGVANSSSTAAIDAEILQGHFHRALELRDASEALVHSQFDHSRAIEMNSVLAYLGRPDLAVDHARRNIVEVEHAWRGDHLMVAQVHQSAVPALVAAGDLRGALEEVHTALAIYARIDAKPRVQHWARGYEVLLAHRLGLSDELESSASAFALTANEMRDPWLEIAALANTTGDYDLGTLAVSRAEQGPFADDERAYSAYIQGDYAGIERPARRALAEGSVDRLRAPWLLAIADARAQRVSAAEAFLANDVRRHADPIHGADSLLVDGLVDAALARWPAAHELFEAAANNARAVWPAYDTRWTILRAALGRARLETGDAADAIVPLELAIVGNTPRSCSSAAMGPACDRLLPSPQYVIADASFALAKALWMTGERTDALVAVNRAIEHYSTFQKAEREVASRWLHDHEH